MFSNFFPKIVPFMRCQKIRWAREDKGKHTPALKHSHICMPSPTRAHTKKYVILTAFHNNSGFMNMPERHFTRTLPLLYHGNNHFHSFDMFGKTISTLQEISHFSQQTKAQLSTNSWCTASLYSYFFSSIWRKQSTWSVVDLLRQNPYWWSPVISSACGVNLDWRIFDRTLHAVDKSDMLQ